MRLLRVILQDVASMPFLCSYYDLNGIRQVSDLDLKSDRECAGLCQIDRNLCNGFVFGGSDRICYLQTIGSVFGVAGAGIRDDVDGFVDVGETFTNSDPNTTTLVKKIIQTYSAMNPTMLNCLTLSLSPPMLNNKGVAIALLTQLLP